MTDPMNAGWFPCDRCHWMRWDCTCPRNPVAQRRVASQVRVRHAHAVERALVSDALDRVKAGTAA